MKIELVLGALSDSFSKQLKRQKVLFDKAFIEKMEKQQEAMLILRFGDYLPDSQYERMRQKLIKKIMTHLKAKNNYQGTGSKQ